MRAYISLTCNQFSLSWRISFRILLKLSKASATCVVLLLICNSMILFTSLQRANIIVLFPAPADNAVENLISKEKSPFSWFENRLEIADFCYYSCYIGCFNSVVYDLIPKTIQSKYEFN